MTQQHASSLLSSLKASPHNYAFLRSHISRLSRPPSSKPLFPSDTVDLSLDSGEDGDPDTVFRQWVQHEMRFDLHQALPSVLQSNAALSILHAPRQHPEYRLSETNFNFNLNRFLCLPVLSSHRRCLCGKTIDIAGNHIFGCKHISKLVLHNNICDAHFVGLRSVNALTCVMSDKDDMKLEPPELSTVHPAVCPLDVAIFGDKGIVGLNITITGVPPIAQQPHAQEKHTSTLHHRKEVEKWRGNLKEYRITEGEGDQPVTVINGSTVISDLIDQDIHLILAVVDAHMREGPTLQWFHSGNQKKPYVSKHNFGTVESNTVGKYMCNSITSDTNFCGVYSQALKEWRRLHGNR